MHLTMKSIRSFVLIFKEDLLFIERERERERERNQLIILQQIQIVENPNVLGTSTGRTTLVDFQKASKISGSKLVFKVIFFLKDALRIIFTVK